MGHNKRVTIRLSEEEYAAVEEGARMERRTVSDYIRVELERLRKERLERERWPLNIPYYKLTTPKTGDGQ